MMYARVIGRNQTETLCVTKKEWLSYQTQPPRSVCPHGEGV